MSAEYEDVLTNQPVVIDNVSDLADACNCRLTTRLERVLAPLKLGLLVRITQNVSFHHSTHLICIILYYNL